MLPQNDCPAIIQETAAILRSRVYRHYLVCGLRVAYKYVCVYVRKYYLYGMNLCMHMRQWICIYMLHGTVFSHHHSNSHWFVVVFPLFGCDSHKSMWHCV